MTDTPNMRERLARAIAGAVYRPQPDMSGDVFARLGPHQRRAVDDAVESVLEELERPTNGMISATYPVQAEYEAKDGGFWKIPPALHSAYWAAMVKAIRGGA
jgi:hypothetical protein